MKSAYELAMERLEKESPQAALNEEQKAEIAEIDMKYRAKLAEREVFLTGKIEDAKAAGEFGEAAELEEELARERKSLESRCEEEKQRVREAASQEGE